MLMQTARTQIAEFGNKMERRGLTEGTAGNLSVYDPENKTMAISPSGISYGNIKPEDIVILDLDGNIIEGKLKPSSEYHMHGEIYKVRPDIRAIVHTHSEYCTILSCLNAPISAVHYVLADAGASSVPVAAYATYGTKELAENAAKALGSGKAVLLANHGMLSCGADIGEAFSVAATCEWVAKIQWKCMCAGNPNILKKNEMNRVISKFQTYGQSYMQEEGGGATNEKYKSYFLMDADTVKDYARHIGCFSGSDNIIAAEIGDGNINYVFKVHNPETGKSIIIKQAGELLRSSGRPLDRYRSKIEAEILVIQKRLAPELIPEVYNYDDIMYAIAMEDISEYKNMRGSLMEGKSFPDFASSISSYFAGALFPTTDLCMDRGEKKELTRLFINKELCDISEDLVFTEPYYDYKSRNIITPGQEDFVNKFLYNNKALHAEIGELRNNFMNNAQALIHGDLHTGSLFINPSGLKIIDPEFAFYGPIGYDIGNVIGNLFFSWAYIHFTNPENREFLRWIETTIADVFNITERKLSLAYDSLVSLPVYKGGFKELYLKNILADSLGYAGTEIIRRVVGDAKVAEISSVTDSEVKIPMERALIKAGIFLIMNRRKIISGNEITEYFSLILS